MADMLRAVVRVGARMLYAAYPLLSGQHRLANIRVLRWACDVGPTNVATRVPGGFLASLCLADNDARSVYFFGCNDGKVRWLLRKVLRPGDTFLDVGANWGAYGLLASKLVGETGQVHFFEPQPELASSIEESIHLNRFRNATVHDCALWKLDGLALLKREVGNSGGASVIDDPVHPDDHRQMAKLRQGDALLTQLGIDRIRLMKVDVEGHEQEVLLGLRHTLCSQRAEMILFESNEFGVPFWSRGAAKLLLDCGYSLFELPRKSLWSVHLKPMSPHSSDPDGHDFLAVAKAVRPPF